MVLYYSGFNSHWQLVKKEDHEDVLAFERAELSHVSVVCALWSTTVLQTNHDDHLIQIGFNPSGAEMNPIMGPPASSLKCVFGDVGNVLGAVSIDGDLFEYKEGDPNRVVCCFSRNELPFKVQHLTIQDSGEVCVCVGDSKLHLFANTNELFSHQSVKRTIALPTPVLQLCGSAATITILSTEGEVLTFGSGPQSAALGRTPDAASPIREPCPIPFLGGIKIKKITSNSWLCAALSCDRDLYVWGGRVSDKNRIGALPALDEGEYVKLVDINGGDDVEDVDVGAEHMVVLTTKAEVWVTGNNTYGQLGIGRRGFEVEWVKVEATWMDKEKVVEVGCGPWCSWLRVDENG